APLPPGLRREQVSGRTQRQSPDFTIELIANDGTAVAAPASRFVEVPPPLKEKFTKFDFVERDRYEQDWEPVFQTIRAPAGGVQIYWRIRVPSPETGRDSAEVRSNCDRGDLHQRNRIGMGLNAMTVTSMIQQSSR